MGLNCVGYSTLTVSSTAVNLFTSPTNAMPNTAHGAVITVETDQIRYRIDGTNPTSTEGHLVQVGGQITFDSWSNGVNWRSVMRNTNFIRVTNDANLKISWFD